MALSHMLTELSAEPCHVVERIRDARATLGHLRATFRAFRQDGNAVHVISQLHLWSGLPHTNNLNDLSASPDSLPVKDPLVSRNPSSVVLRVQLPMLDVLLREPDDIVC